MTVFDVVAFASRCDKTASLPVKLLSDDWEIVRSNREHRLHDFQSQRIRARAFADGEHTTICGRRYWLDFMAKFNIHSRAVGQAETVQVSQYLDSRGRE